MARLFLVLRRSDRSRQGPLADFGGWGFKSFRADLSGAVGHKFLLSFRCLTDEGARPPRGQGRLALIGHGDLAEIANLVGPV
jgi:hypothetical protein